MKTCILLLTTGIVLAGTVTAQAQSRLIDRIMKADRNGDGKISLKEAPERMKQNFARLDKNSDGFVGRKELEAAFRNLGNRNAAAALPEGVTLKENVAYREGNPKWTLDLYLPQAPAPEGGRPGLVVVHGGGWRSGDKKGGIWSRIPAEYAAKGYVAIGVNYRLTPEVKIIDCIADVKCAVRWLRANAKKYDLDPNRIGAYGNSAGAHLVSMLGLTDSEDMLEGDGPYQEFSSRVQAVCASATPTDFLNWGKGGSRTRIAELADEARAAKVSPITYVSKEAPPFLLVHATDDRTVPYNQGKSLKEKLEKAGAKVAWMSYENGGHGVYNAKSKETGPAMEKFFKQVLGKKTDSSNE